MNVDSAYPAGSAIHTQLYDWPIDDLVENAPCPVYDATLVFPFLRIVEAAGGRLISVDCCRGISDRAAPPDALGILPSNWYPNRRSRR